MPEPTALDFLNAWADWTEAPTAESGAPSRTVTLLLTMGGFFPTGARLAWGSLAFHPASAREHQVGEGPGNRLRPVDVGIATPGFFSDIGGIRWQQPDWGWPELRVRIYLSDPPEMHIQPNTYAKNKHWWSPFFLTAAPLSAEAPAGYPRRGLLYGFADGHANGRGAFVTFGRTTNVVTVGSGAYAITGPDWLINTSEGNEPSG